MNEQAEESKQHGKHVEIHVQDIKEAERVTFPGSITATLMQVWDKAYVEQGRAETKGYSSNGGSQSEVFDELSRADSRASAGPGHHQ